MEGLTHYQIGQRNLFIAAALQGLLASEGGKASDPTKKKEEIVQHAFEFADLILQESMRRHKEATKHFQRSPDPW